LKLTLPANLEPHAPVAMAVARDYAEYRSLYKVESHVFTAERVLRFRLRVVPASRASDYLAFTRAVQSDEAQELALESTAPGTPTIPANAKAADLNETGAAALDNRNYAAAAELFARVTELEPKHKSAWNNLGRAYLGLGKSSEAVAAFRKQIEVNPFDQYAYNNLGLAYLLQRNYDAAAEAFRKQIENNPLDKFAHASLGSIYIQQKKYAEAVPELEKATVLNPDNAALQVALGRAYLNLNQNDKALASFDRAVEMAPSPGVWNDVAYELARHNLQLDRAEQYAESAIAATAAALRNVELDRLTLQDLSLVGSLGAYWDTLGWVRFQKGDLDAAEKFVLAAWQLDLAGDARDLRAQISERRG
jgi:tetratricopeptide (TPR) repeat protein